MSVLRMPNAITDLIAPLLRQCPLQADALAQYKIFVMNSDRPELEDDEVYVTDLMDMEVVMKARLLLVVC